MHLVGKGTQREVVEALVRDLPGRVEWTEQLPTEGVARALDAATCLLLPSRSEGMGRVLVEAFCRGRVWSGSKVGGIVDLVKDGENGLLVPPEHSERPGRRDPPRAGRAELAERLGAGARASAEAHGRRSPEEYAARLEALVAGLR